MKQIGSYVRGFLFGLLVAWFLFGSVTPAQAPGVQAAAEPVIVASPAEVRYVVVPQTVVQQCILPEAKPTQFSHPIEWVDEVTTLVIDTIAEPVTPVVVVETTQEPTAEPTVEATLVPTSTPTPVVVSATPEVPCVGNPGNPKCVGKAGEEPNGKDGWKPTPGIKGRSDK